MAVPIKATLAFIGVLSLFGGSYYCSTQIGFRTEGALDLKFKASRSPIYDAVGRNLYSHDGTKLMVTAITRERGTKGTGTHVIHASVKGTHRYALQLFPTRMVHSFSMNRQAVERTVLEAAGMPQTEFVSTEREWHVIQ